MIRTEYGRRALESGLRLEGTLGVNPFKFGAAGGTDTHTGLLEASRRLGDGTLRLQLFGDTLFNDRFVSYGFPGSYRTQIGKSK